MWRTLHVFAFAVLGSVVWGQDADESRVVTLTQGQVRGFRTTSYNVFDFLNIPYATAPTGTDKFKAPLPPPTWNETLHAIDRGIACPQANFDFSTSIENCLVANIFAPGTEQNNLPVVVIVHGGAYQLGIGSMVTARGFVDSQRVIAITFNYRLSVHGFLCLGTENAPGNAGMKDQVALLRWVKENIESFGGDPDDVTISGCSAGGSAVDTLLLSKMADGLFNKVIPESGCSTAPFGAQLDPLQNAKDHVLRLNFTDVDVENITALEEFYTTTSLEILTRYSFLDSRNTYFIFQPCVEKDIGQEMFLADAPINIIRSGNYTKLPMLFGYAHKEGMFRLPQFDNWKVEMNEHFSNFLPGDLEFKNEEEKEKLTQKVKQFYFGNETVNEDTILSFVNYFSDVMFITPVHRAITLQVNANNTEVYLYDYSFVHSGSLVIPHVNEPGASHCDQVQAFVDVPFTSPEFLEMSRTMRQMLLEFINTGNPTPQGHNFNVTWLPAGSNRAPYLSVGSTIEAVEFPPLGDRAEFWDAIYESHYRTPIPPNPNVTDTDPEPNAAALHLVSKQCWVMCAVGVALILYGH